jgi:hypothetical protein
MMLTDLAAGAAEGRTDRFGRVISVADADNPPWGNGPFGPE